MILKSKFQLIIPFSYQLPADGWAVFDDNFNSQVLHKSSQLENSPLLTPESSLLAIMELKQNRRVDIGLHQNENRPYLLIKKSIPFHIGKVKLWCFRGNIAFCAIEVSSDELDSFQVLDMVSMLSDTKSASVKIGFEQSIGKNEKETRIISMRQVIKNICTLGTTVSLAPLSTEQKAFCLFYGTTHVNSSKDLLYFLEMLRCQHPSNRSVNHELSDENRYNHYTYITWAVSENVLACVADLNTESEENIRFLSNPGGLQYSIFSNYLAICLAGLALNQRFLSFQRRWPLFNNRQFNELPEAAIVELHEILNTPIYNLANVDHVHINSLFNDYFFDRALGLKGKLELISGNETQRYIEEIYKRIVSIDVRTEKMERQLSAVATFVEHDLNKWIAETRNALVFVGGDEDDHAIAQFISSTSRHINQNIGVGPDLIAITEQELKTSLGIVWDRIDKTSRTSLVSASVLRKSCSTILNVDFDFSGVCISTTSALESELKRVFYAGFQEYLVKRYGAPTNLEENAIYDAWPEELLGLVWEDRGNTIKTAFTWSEYDKLMSKNKKPQIVLGNYFTMGSLPYLFGKRSNNKDLLQARMRDYLKTILRSEYTKAPLKVFNDYQNSQNFVKQCEQVREQYRNPAAHTDVLPKSRADACYLAVVGQDNTPEESAAGLLLLLYQYLK